MKSELSFGEYVTERRKSLGITLRGMAGMINIAPAYLSDIEKGRRYPPDMEKLEAMVKVLKLNDEERYILFDLAGQGKNTVSPDLPEFIMEEDLVRVALRKAKAKGKLDEKVWKELIEKLD